MRILLFDDIGDQRARVKSALQDVLGQRGDVQEFAAAVGGVTEGTHEARLRKDLLTAPNHPASLILADRDLSSYMNEYRGLSEETVRRVADTLGVPECGYARGDRPDDPAYVKRAEQREACIRLSLAPIDTFAKRVVAIADGFLTIGEGLTALKDAGQKVPPAKLLATLLGKPEYADKIALYASGDQSRLQAVHRILAITDQNEKIRRMTCLLGYWLWDSVLRFPGVTVGVIPAGSYLNILQSEFEENDVRELFAGARYNGPFAAAKVDMWWRGMLDDLVAEDDCADGREFASKKLGREIPRSECCEDASIPAGYYCMLKEKPVSLKNSKGGLPWFPRGADLARVSTLAIEELGPWL